MSTSASDICLKCNETRGAIRNERLICWDGYDGLGRHRFKPWQNLLSSVTHPTHASDPTQVGTTGRPDAIEAQTGAEHRNERNE